MIKTKPFVIAEIGNNHEGKLSVAKRLVLSAKSRSRRCQDTNYKARKIFSFIK